MFLNTSIKIKVDECGTELDLALKHYYKNSFKKWSIGFSSPLEKLTKTESEVVNLSPNRDLSSFCNLAVSIYL